MSCCRNCHWWDRDDDTVEDVCLFGPLMIKIPYPLLEENDCINYMDNSEIQLVQAKIKIKELEIQLDKYVGMCANCPDLGNGYFALKDLEAEAAAMREALALGNELERMAYDASYYFDDGYTHDGDNALSEKCEKRSAEIRQQMEQALAPDAGKKLLERLAKAEEQVSAFTQGEYGRQLGYLIDKVQGLEAELKKAEGERDRAIQIIKDMYFNKTPESQYEELHNRALALVREAE